MSNQINQSSQYPAGYIQYAFKMHVNHERAISCKLAHSNTKELILEKVNPADEFDPEWRMTVHFGPVHSIEEVDEIGNAIKDDIFDLLSFTLNSKIAGIRLAGHGLTPRPGEGAIGHLLIHPFECKGTARSGGLKLSNDNVQEVQDTLSSIPASWHKPLINLFRHAIATDEPIVQFLILYLILYDKFGNQPEVDRQIILHEPATPQSISPHSRRPETIYTRLRNEIAHRARVGLDATRAEIIDNLDRFRMIVHGILKSMV